ncbi:glycosyltransferase involved in cell wall biosynthesis [Salirhabdus euzebyi]|uniref:Glycosyltransferase involved in cell wall biosynthesis n=1 Tax=Salirhabdus euzebyi TaxID=394506 RepID=A0A841Q7V8_9BACI|nr:glycosyltransferase family 2 protein [Salirhabdus euzebyi]MBB6454510.1 glycosyltransferase involved in cell wall biosynthesis [Salirhabdus euzebyi]
MMISVCMATYNGEKFVIQQLESVLKQLNDTDEIIVVDDGSKDRTVELIKRNFGERVKVNLNENNLGVIKSFEKAIKMAKGEYIFLCDQDDVWEEVKVSKILEAFKNENAMLVTHDALVVDASFEVIHPSWNEYNGNKVKQNIIGNLLKNAFTGCMMAFRKELVPYIVPFPQSIEMHDQWIALVCKIEKKKIVHLSEPLMKYVRHGNNVTGMKKRSIAEQVKGRLGTIKSVKQYKNKK